MLKSISSVKPTASTFVKKKKKLNIHHWKCNGFWYFFNGLPLYISKPDYYKNINVISFGSPVLKP
jgi:hypothetical protein